MSKQTFHVRAERGTDRSVWVLQCTEHPGAISQAKSLKKAPEMMREAIAFVADVAPDSFDLVVQAVLDPAVERDVLQAKRMMRELQEQQLLVGTRSRETVKQLVATGLSQQDIAVVLEVSPQRVNQLVT